MQKIRSSNPPVVTGICDPNKSQAQHHRSLKLDSKLKHLNIELLYFQEKCQKKIIFKVIRNLVILSNS